MDHPVELLQELSISSLSQKELEALTDFFPATKCLRSEELRSHFASLKLGIPPREEMSLPDQEYDEAYSALVCDNCWASFEHKHAQLRKYLFTNRGDDDYRLGIDENQSYLPFVMGKLTIFVPDIDNGRMSPVMATTEDIEAATFKESFPRGISLDQVRAKVVERRHKYTQ